MDYDYINPTHYQNGPMEVIDMMRAVWGDEYLIAYCEMNAFKYRMRMGLKPDQDIEQELKKAQWYENKARELRDDMKYTPETTDSDSPFRHGM